MANPKPPARDLFRSWGESVVPVEDASASNARRARIVASMSNTITRAAAERARTKRRVRWGTGLAFAAVTLLATGAAFRFRAPHSSAHAPEASAFAHVHSVSGTVRATHGTGTSALAAGEVALGAGDEVMTDQDGRGDVTLADGVTIALEGASNLRLPAPSLAANDGKEQVHLDVGTVHIRVPHMPAGHTFSVKTPDAEVTVHGTAFTVEVAPAFASVGDGPATRVRVSEGVVSVASGGHEVLLTAGMQWPPPPVAIASPAPVRSTQPAPKSRTSTSAHRHGSASSSDSAEASSLAEQNTLLAQAMDASRAGDDRHAIELLTDLLSHYPSSPLAQEARVQRFRALDRSGNHRGAAREARLYLAAYPTGFARDEAKQLALEP